jgi:cell division topological specificity factor
MGLFERLFSPRGERASSKEDAKARLKVLLVHDQVDLTPAMVEAMQAEICAVIARYCDVDRDHVAVRLERAPDGVAVVSSVPVRRVTQRGNLAPVETL